MRIGELAKATATKVETIRYYEQTGLLSAPARTPANYRSYGADHLARLSFIRRARDLGFSIEQVRALLDLAAPNLKAAVMLGINGGFGNTDCSALPEAAIDFERAIIYFERPKTAVRRILPLWP